ncbi:putative signal transducing protein [Psychroflexus sp. ALD_RP9]|uniref:putative signal transducing protein n=1 Tax=Psychroflexus sp. ALD_RP9 TaxID=2777186 RepID=UPI001A8EA2DE|nr:DUF2007 domain-containing protein [Psychroflexus sp. ALD_RP9]QSS98159.1 DUF2007 domain-containing protein [Psychroflexus sp. ALD_RP9]
MDKIRVYSSKNEIEANCIVLALEEQGIVPHMINKTDSAHAKLFGYIEVYVDNNHQAKAEQVIKDYFK